ncbi:hypothetical protein [Salibacter halophilus]|uniref:Uncharacterized protein n=1 Tax=Salibacter halophilus TaxID=1803916 RepID=A0A6N6MAI8_9FLAO|nr:hypothetical protein [Salibacter halophilus]KAB1065276.1 hypothetical protein F3059_04795 [Salibacter halophilus]
MKTTLSTIWILILILISCESYLKKDSKDPDFPYTLSQILEYKLIGESVEFSAIYPDSSSKVLNMFCDTFDANPELYLDKYYTKIDSTTYHFFHASPVEFPWIDEAGTFYFNIDNLDSLFQYNEEFKYPSDSLTELIIQSAADENMTISELLKFRQFESSTFWTPKLFFVIGFNECEDMTLLKINEAIMRIDNSLEELKTKYLESGINLTPRIIIKKRVPTAPKKTWGGQWFTQGSFFVATFVTGGQESTPKSPTFLSCKTLCSL